MYTFGDRVTIHDGSWSMTIRGDKLEHAYGTMLMGRVWEVISADMVLPKAEDDFTTERINDLYLKAEDNGQIVFICSSFVKPYVEPVEECPHCKNCYYYKEAARK